MCYGAQGVVNLVTAAQRQGRVQRVVLVSSVGADDPLFPLNLLWGVRQTSSLELTIVTVRTDDGLINSKKLPAHLLFFQKSQVKCCLCLASMLCDRLLWPGRSYFGRRGARRLCSGLASPTPLCGALGPHNWGLLNPNPHIVVHGSHRHLLLNSLRLWVMKDVDGTDMHTAEFGWGDVRCNRRHATC